jgi:hypothetical protein
MGWAYIKDMKMNMEFWLEISLKNSYSILPIIYANEGALSKGCHLDVVGGPSTPHDPESNAGGSLSSWQGHPSR